LVAERVADGDRVTLDADPATALNATGKPRWGITR
jgi:hypothetical protein